MVPAHFCWYALIHSAMAFFWAEEPWALSVPVPQSTAAAEPEALAPALGSLLSEPHALRPSVAARARQAMVPYRWSFT